MSYDPIDFSKPQYIEVSRRGEQVIEGIKVQATMLGKPAAYINLTQESPLGRDHRIPISPTQARALAAILINFANQEETGKFSPEALEYTLPEEKGLDPSRPTPEHQWFIDWRKVAVRFSERGVSFSQEGRDYLRPNQVDHVHLSPTQFQSFITQGIKHSPKLRQLLHKALKETI